MKNKKLYRNNEDSVIAGVCGGLADYFEIDVTLVRVIFVLLLIGGGSGFLIYLVLWLITPIKGEKETDFKEEAGELLEKTAKKTKTMTKEIKKEIFKDKRIKEAKKDIYMTIDKINNIIKTNEKIRQDINIIKQKLFI
jgi:phage shock protein C